MINAKEEFLAQIAGKPEVVCAFVKGSNYGSLKGLDVLLKKGYSSQDYADFLSKLDFEYSDGYGSQNMEGGIWYKGGTWSDRGEYDGSEWWSYKKVPEIPKELK